MVIHGQSPPDLIVSTVKYICQRPLWLCGQRIFCTDLMMLYTALLYVRSQNIFPENSPAHTM